MASDQNILALPARAPGSAIVRRLVFWACLAALLALGWSALSIETRRSLLLWAPALASGFGLNIAISVLAIALGTIGGLMIGALGVSTARCLRAAAHVYVQFFRNAPWLVLIYFATYVFPFEIAVGPWTVPFPDWLKVTLGLALPASANVAEIFRGALAGIPSTQWEAARSLAMTRGQILRWIIVPQCLRRMLPPWMNLYAIVTMGTALASLVGTHDLLDMAQLASNTVSRSEFTVLIYLTVLLVFFLYCYPISRLTQILERSYGHA
ncbi:MAG: amino acid ABC transporter permease [Pollutimonas bauzanensis]|uniref:Polar amino acid transport system permease protein n=1 Tax=Pollutimonas bauzanensis TaxID=658167 RepID=A0A1M5NJ49_9BURK|nr:amino acid ABC transporter permease [Pollutimonas bauzanensis]SHG89465.1 polar amino acid transport system permease protein [Pollutimonas bauzanensis]